MTAWVLGNWGADQRNLRRWRRCAQPDVSGGLDSAVRRLSPEERVRSVANQTYFGGDIRTYDGTPAFPYHRYYDASIT